MLANNMTRQNKMAAIRAAWLRRNERETPFFVEAGENIKATRELISDPATDLARQQTALDACASIGDYSVPSLKPNLGIGVMAVAFGCPYVLDDNTDPWVKPVIFDENAKEVFALAQPDPHQSGLFPQALGRISHFLKDGRYPVRSVNIPSPLLTASLVWEYGSFIAALLTNQREVHVLLEKITTATLAFLRVQRACNLAPFSWSHESVYIPTDLAIRVSDDVAAVLTSDLYREFGVRYNNEIAREFGGIVVHSCGDISRTLPAMLETEHLLGVDIVAPQNNLGAVRDVTAGGLALCLRYFDWDFPTGETPKLKEYSLGLLDIFRERGTLLWTHTPTIAEAQDLALALHQALKC